MKKILFIILLILSVNVYASSDMYIDSYIMDNGDVLIKKVVDLHDSYNGLEIKYDYSYDGEESIYDSDELKLLKVCSSSGNIFQNNFKVLDCYKQVDSAVKGDSKVYTYNFNILKIFNPSYEMEGESFYIEYILKDTAVKYNDIADLKLSIFDKGFNEYLNNFEMRINLPKEDSNYRVWGHGPLYGEVTRKTNKTASIKVTDLPSDSPIYVRLVFNKDLIPNSTKIVNRDMFDNIIEEETIYADKANKEREEAVKELERLEVKKQKQKIVAKYLSIIWLIGLIGFLVHKKKKDNENKDITFKNEYFRDFPDNASPEEIRLLVENKLDSISLSSSLLNIIRKKGFKIEEFVETKGFIMKKEVKDYKLTLVDDILVEPLTEEEKHVRSWFVDFYGNDNSFLLSSMKKRITSESEARKFMDKYNTWQNNTREKLNKKGMYEKDNKFKNIFGLYITIPWIIGFLYSPFIMPLVLVSIPAFIYVVLSKRKTKEGNLRYSKWKALKKFMSDFGRFSDKELPEIVLWEKYLVYANAFGIADKLKKQMEIKIQDVNMSSMDMVDYMVLNDVINNSITNGVSSAISSASSTLNRVASSSSSSGGGFGGGFSSGGGGSFGGGGGMSGGRF